MRGRHFFVPRSFTNAGVMNGRGRNIYFFTQKTDGAEGKKTKNASGGGQ